MPPSYRVAIVQIPDKSLQFPICRGPLEGKDRWCVRCERIELGLQQ